MASIIVIEDNIQTARLAVKLLARRGHTVETISTGEEGMLKVFEHVPDLILVDLGLPDIDGQTVISLLRQEPEIRTTPVIAFTAWPIETAQKMAEAYGCDGVITKPVNTRTFAKEIEHFLRPVVAPQQNR